MRYSNEIVKILGVIGFSLSHLSPGILPKGMLSTLSRADSGVSIYSCYYGRTNGF